MDDAGFHVDAASAYADALDDFASAVTEREGSKAAMAVASAMDVAMLVLDSLIPADPIASPWPKGRPTTEPIPFLARSRMLSLRGDSQLRRLAIDASNLISSEEGARVAGIYKAAAMCATEARERKEVDDKGTSADALIAEYSAKALIVETIRQRKPLPAQERVILETLSEMAERGIIARDAAEALVARSKSLASSG
jgi:hypothetical protein